MPSRKHPITVASAWAVVANSDVWSAVAERVNRNQVINDLHRILVGRLEELWGKYTQIPACYMRLVFYAVGLTTVRVLEEAAA